MQQGFDYCYDKKLYDRLLAQDAAAVRSHLWADLAYQDKLARFLENHDEPRAAHDFPPPVHQAAAIITYLTPGLRFFHEGQFEGRRVKVSMHLGRRPEEAVDPALQEFYQQLLGWLKRPEVREGRWQLLEARQAWEGNPTWDRFLTFVWEGGPEQRLLIAVNYGATQGQCYVSLPWDDLRGRKVILQELVSGTGYEREGDNLLNRGLYLDLPAWGFHLVDMVKDFSPTFKKRRPGIKESSTGKRREGAWGEIPPRYSTRSLISFKEFALLYLQ
jgi:hypothetical protein